MWLKTSLFKGFLNFLASTTSFLGLGLFQNIFMTSQYILTGFVFDILLYISSLKLSRVAGWLEGVGGWKI